MVFKIAGEKLKNIFFSAPRIIFINFYRLILRKRIFNFKNIPGQGPAILAINHVTGADPIIVLAALRKKIIFLADSKCFETKISDFFFRHFTSSIPVFKKQFSKNFNSFKELFGIFNIRNNSKKPTSKKNGSVFLAIFPEGQLNKRNELDTFSKGTAYLSYKLKLPIIPVYLSNIFKGPQRGNWFRKRPVLEGLITILFNAFKKVHVFIGNPIDPFAESILGDLKDLADKETYKLIIEKINSCLKEEFAILKNESDALINHLPDDEPINFPGYTDSKETN